MILLAAAVVTACSAELTTFDPYVAVMIWSDHTREEVAATNRSACECARAVLSPRVPGVRLVESYCDHRSGFPVGWGVIHGFNDR